MLPSSTGQMGGSTKRQEVPAIHGNLPCSPVAAVSELCCAQEWEAVLGVPGTTVNALWQPQGREGRQDLGRDSSPPLQN